MTITEIFATIRDWAVGKFQPKGEYAASGDIPTKVSDLENDEGFLTAVPDDYVTETGLTAKGYLTEETDPTVPEWAKQPEKPQYTANEIGADVAGSASVAVENHNLSTTAHEDIRNLLNEKVDKESGKGLSSNDYTDIEKSKLSGISAGAEVNVQADWDITDENSDAYIKHKPNPESAPVSTAQQTAIDAAYQQSTGYTDQKIAELINGAPSTLDTLGEIAEAMQDNQDVVAALEQAIGTKANEADLNGHISNSTIHTSASEKAAWNNKMEKTGDASNTTVAFAQATARANIASGEKLSTIMGKIMKFFADLNPVAFSGKYTDLTDTPSIPTSSNIYQRHDALSDGTPIVTNSTDWNTLISPGSYKVTSGSTIADGINAPTGEHGNGLMFVIRNIDSNNQSYIFQLYFPTVPRYSAMWIRYSYGTNVDTTGSLVWGYWVKSPWVNNNNYVYGMGERVYFTNADNTVTKAGIVMQNYRSYGIEMLIGAGGNTFIGAGESVVYAPQWLSDNTIEWPHGKPAYDGPGGEIMYFTSDSGFYFLSNMGSLDNNGAVRGRFICIDTNSHLYPSEDRAQQLGRSGNRWSKVWANEIGMGGTTDNSRIVWADDGILRFFGANKARIGTDLSYLDISGVTLGSEAIIARAASRIESNTPYMIKCTDGKSSTYLIIGVLNPNAAISDTTITPSGSRLNILTNGGGLRVLNKSSTSIDGVSTTLVYDPIEASKFLTYSSSRYKENIRNMTEEEALQILKYRVVSYDYKIEYGGEKDQQGLIAEEAYDINSFQISLDEDGQPNSIDYSKFVPSLIKMAQIQQKQIENLKQEVERLKNK